SDDDRPAARERDAIEIFGRYVRESRVRHRPDDLVLRDLGEAQIARLGLRARRSRLELVGEEERRNKPADGRLAVRHVKQIVNAELVRAEHVRDGNPAVVHGAVHPRARRHLAIEALPGRADLDLVVRAANADRRLRGEELVAVAGELADLSRERAKAPLYQTEHGDLATVVATGEVVFFDPEFSIGLEGDKRVVGKSEVRMALRR